LTKGGIGKFGKETVKRNWHDKQDELLKSPPERHPGGSPAPVPPKAGLKSMDSGFRLNDEIYLKSTFYEIINIEEFAGWEYRKER
jgi:hypothetical protein